MYNMTNSIKTPAGSELTLISLKGKKYLQVAHRLIWFREEKPEWSIQTRLLEHDVENGYAVVEARLGYYADGLFQVIQTGLGSESRKDFRDYLEKAETKAVGRALAMAGYGTQFALADLDEGERIVDAPVSPPQKPTISRDRAGLFQTIQDIMIEKKLPKERVGQICEELYSRKTASELGDVELKGLIEHLETVKES